MKRIIVVGSYNTGLSMRVRRTPRAGETVLGTGYSEGPGGKGSNQAVAAARLGGRVSFVGCVGKDRFGDAAFDLWGEEGVDSRHVSRSSKHTGLGFVIVEESGANVITVDTGANADLATSQVEAAIAGVPRGSVMLLQLEVPVRTVNATIREGKKRGLTVILNPAPPAPLSQLDLRHVDVISPNEVEASKLTGTPDLGAASERLLEAGAKAAIITIGEKGSYLRTSEEAYRVRPPRVEAVDTTGAGDAFNGALAVALSEGREMRDAVRFANVAGALTVTRREVIPALPSRDDVDRLVRKLRG